MKITNKEYCRLKNMWSNADVVYIRYKTKHSCGKITCSIVFIVEFYSRLLKLLKKVEIVELYVKDENSGLVKKYYTNL